MKEKDISSIYKILILYENIDNDLKVDSYLNYIDRLYVYWVGVGEKEIYEDNYEFYLTLGIACLYVGDIGAASSYFQLARRIKLTDTRLLMGQAAIFLRRGDTARAP